MNDHPVIAKRKKCSSIFGYIFMVLFVIVVIFTIYQVFQMGK